MPADSSHQIGQTVGARLRTARLAKKYTQNQLARPDFSVSYISAIERGQIQPSLRALEILAQRLDLSATDLLPTPSALAGAAAFESKGTAEGSEEWNLLLLEAQIAIHQKAPQRALDLLKGLLPQRGERRQQKSCVIYYILGWACLAGGDWQESEQLLAEASWLAKEATDPLYPCILSLQSMVYTTMRNTEQATQLQREMARALARYTEASGNAFFLARLHASLAQHYSHLGDFAQAAEQLQQTLRLLQEQTSCQHLQKNYQQLVQSYAEKEHYLLASLYSRKWSLADQHCQSNNLRSDIEYALGRALLRSDQEQAQSYLQNVLQEAQVRQDHRAQAGAHTQLASLALAHNELAQADQHIQRALEEVGPAEHTLIRADIHLVAGELAYRRQDYISGDHAFEAGLTLFEQVGAREDLIEHLARYAQLLEERNCIQKALIYWKRAFESRQQNHPLSL